MIRNFSLVLLFALLAGCASEKSSVSAAPVTPAYQTATVEVRSIAAELALPATVQPDPARVVHVFAPLSGRLVSLKVKAGDRVRAGQPVAVIQSSDAAGARSDYEKARAQSERSEAALRRATLLFQHEVIAAKDLEDATAQAASDKSDLARTRERLELLGLGDAAASDMVTVRAPRSGVVVETTSASGEFSKSLDASNPLLTIADLDSVWVVGNCYERDLESVRRGSEVSITTDAWPGRRWRGRIDSIADVLDPATRTVKVRVVLGNADRSLKPDMFAGIHVSRPALRVAVVPAVALLHEGNDAFVIVQKAKDSFEKRAVQVERSSAQEVLLRSGLNAGESVVTTGAELLREVAR
jgi:cobalt-zinc-cadmium efflux system membrane fusion protein